MRIVPRIISLSLAALIISTLMLSGCTKKTNTDVEITKEDPEGKLVVTVMDKDTKKPIGDADIIVIGKDSTYKTDDKGMSPEITLKINKDMYKKYGGDLWQKAPSGSAAVLVSKGGYKDYIIFNKALYPGYSSNRLKVELQKSSKNDKQKFEVGFEKPHDVWVEELVKYSAGIEEIKEGSGNCKLTVTVKDQNSKALEGVSVVIPELSIKGVTDKAGKVVLMPGSDKDVFDVYPVGKEYMEYTIVTAKEGYNTEVVLNAAIYKEKDNNISIKLKQSKEKDGSGFVVSFQPFDSGWVEKVIESCKNENTESTESSTESKEGTESTE